MIPINLDIAEKKFQISMAFIGLEKACDRLKRGAEECARKKYITFDIMYQDDKTTIRCAMRESKNFEATVAGLHQDQLSAISIPNGNRYLN